MSNPVPSNPLDLARQWRTASEQHLELQKQREILTRQIETLAEQRTTLDRDLRALLGANTPQRLFQVEVGVVVMVSSTRGVEVVQLEATAGGAKKADGEAV